MTTRPREDIVQDLLEKQIELYLRIKNTIEKHFKEVKSTAKVS